MTPAQILTRLAIVAAVCAGLWLFWRHYDGLVAARAQLTSERDQALQANKDQLAENAQLRIRGAWVDAVLVERTRQLQEHKLERKKTDDERNAIHARPDVKPWADTALPAAVADRLRRAGANGADRARIDAGAAAAGAAAGNAGAAVQR